MKPFVTIIVPERNEQRHIAHCLESIITQDYGRENFEVIVVDGASIDKSCEIISDFQHQYSNITLLHNPKLIVPISFNLGLRQAKGDIIIIVGGHAALAPNYITQCVQAMEETKAECVGGPITSINESKEGRSIALAMSSKFGVGNARFRVANFTGYVDTLAFGAYKRSVFEQVGIFDEALVRCQDDEFNYRLLKNGGKIYMTPKIHSQYFPRTNLKQLWRQYYQYGMWKVRVLQKHPSVMQPRQFAPPLFVFTLSGLSVLSIFVPLARLALAGILVLYGTVVFASALYAWRKAEDCALPILLASFPILHVSYGLGFLYGLVKFWNRWGELENNATIAG
jgi:succinoglycan biosynthesis protein ExoA